VARQRAASRAGKSSGDDSVTPALTDRESHYDFGDNWAQYAEGVTDAHIERATAALTTLVGPQLAGKSFLEIGCGSGIHSLAALRLGAASLVAFDIDARAVETARVLLTRYWPENNWRVEQRSIFDVAPGSLQVDVVYSWGVLHHTGDMWAALDRAISLVAPGGRLVIALYRKTPMCPFWRVEKRLYAHGPQWYRRAAETAFTGLFAAALLASGRNPQRYIETYGSARGMNFATDIRDWLGGYPYQSGAPAEVRRRVEAKGFTQTRFYPCNTRFGLLGVGCDEYVFAAAAPAA
jgi:SAM-dependent methyltransferase